MKLSLRTGGWTPLHRFGQSCHWSEHLECSGGSALSAGPTQDSRLLVPLLLKGQKVSFWLKISVVFLSQFFPPSDLTPTKTGRNSKLASKKYENRNPSSLWCCKQIRIRRWLFLLHSPTPRKRQFYKRASSFFSVSPSTITPPFPSQNSGVNWELLIFSKQYLDSSSYLLFLCEKINPLLLGEKYNPRTCKKSVCISRL